MEKINENFYKVEGIMDLVEFCKINQKPRKLWLKRLAFLENLNSYYLFAVSSALIFQESLFQGIELLKEGRFKSNEYDYFNIKSHSSAISFYSHSRVCIETVRILSEEAIIFSQSEEKAELLQKHRDSNKSWVTESINKRNAITAHPHNIRKMIIGPSSWGSSGEIMFNTVDLEHVTIARDEYTLDPVKDLKELKKYIEATLSHLKSIWGFYNFTTDRDISVCDILK